MVDDRNLFSALEEIDKLGDIDMEPIDLGSNHTDNFDLFAEIEKYETLDSRTDCGGVNWESSLSGGCSGVQQVRSSVIVGRHQQSQPSQPSHLKLPNTTNKSPKILPGEDSHVSSD